jgi:Fic family protein
MYVAPAPPLDEMLRELEKEGAGALVRVVTAPDLAPREYIHWDKLRHLDPPEGFTHREWWATIKWARLSSQRKLPLADAEGHPFTYSMPDQALRLLHHVDQHCSGEIAMPEVVTADEHAQRRYLVNSLMEEAIRSSQLEGATTSRRVAKELIRSGRPPKDRSEQMIVNNYTALLFMRDHIDEDLTPGLVLELQRILTQDTLDNPDAAGRMQRPDEERVAVIEREDGSVIHHPPPADQLPDRLRAMCAFANQKDEGPAFLHPVVRAILLHFWVGYDHPFEDGNGRTARALFYWAMKRQGYWLVEYLSISHILRNAPGQYSRAFVLTETDERDTTYFVLYQLKVLERAVEELHRYLNRKVTEVKRVESLIRDLDTFNHRQLAVLGESLRDPERSYTFRSHAAEHMVTPETARHDLQQLQSRGLFERRKDGKQFVFHPTPDLANRLRSVG